MNEYILLVINSSSLVCKGRGGTLALEIDVGLDKARDERARQGLQPVVAADVGRQRANDVLEQMLLAVDRGGDAVVAVEDLPDPVQAADRSEMRTSEGGMTLTREGRNEEHTAKTEKTDEGSPGTRRQSGLTRK